MSAIRSQLLQPPKPKDLFMLFLMCESPKFAAVWHLNISTLRLPKHLFSRSMRYRSLQHVRQLLFAVSLGRQLWLHVAVRIGLPWKTTWFPWKEPILEIKVDVQYFLSYTLPLEFLIYMQPQKFGAPHPELHTVMANCLLRQLSPGGHTDPGRAL